MSSSSAPTVKSLSLQVNELTQKLEALTQQVAALSVAAPAPAPAEGEGGKKARKPRAPKKERDPDAPKKPLSGFMLFSKHQRDAHTGADKLTAGMLGERWNALTDAEKAAFKVVTPPASDAE